MKFCVSGTRYAYSNFGYVVLGRVIERASGVGYESYIQNMLLKIGITRIKLGRSRKCMADPDEVNKCVAGFPTAVQSYNLQQITV